MPGSDGTGSDRVPMDYEALKRLERMGDARASYLLSVIEPQIEEHMGIFLENLLGDEMDSEQRRKFMAQMQNVITAERNNFAQYITRKTITETPELPTDFHNNMKAAKSQIEKENDKKNKEKDDKTKGMSAGERELAEKKEALKENKNEPEKKDPPKQKSEVLGVARKNPTIRTFLEAAPVADVLAQQYDQDHEAFHEAIEDLHSPEGGQLILAMLNAIVSREGDQSRNLLLFAFDLFPELFEKLDYNQLNDMAGIYEKEAIKYGSKYGISDSKIKDLRIRNCAQVPEKVEGFENKSLEERKWWTIVGIGGQCRQKAMEFASRSETVIKDTIHNNVRNNDDIANPQGADNIQLKYDEDQELANQKVILTVLDDEPITELDFLSDNEKRELKIKKEHQKAIPSNEKSDITQVVYIDYPGIFNNYGSPSGVDGSDIPREDRE